MSYEGGGGNASTWSTFPATQNVTVTGYNLDVDTITGLGGNMVTLSAIDVDGNNFLTLDGNIIGAQGATGATGSQILYGSTTPGLTAGTANDTYINTTNGDVYSKTSSTEWNPTSSSSLAWKLVASDSTGDFLAACVQNGKIWTSDNAGGIWIETSAPSANWTSIASDSNGTKLVACVSGGKIWYSLNYGTTWGESDSETGAWSSVASNSTGDKLVACVDGSTIYFSQDYGATWGESDAPALAWTSVACNSNGTLYVACVGGGKIWTSSDGQSWTETTALTSSWRSVACSSGQFLVACISYGTIWTSVDGGLNWTETGSPPNSWTSVKCTPDESKLIASVDLGGIWTSIDAGATWVESDAPFLNWKSVTTDSTGTKLVACATGEPIYTNSGSWTLELNITGPTGPAGADGTTFSYIGTWIEGSYAVNTLAVDSTDNNTYVCIVQTEPPDLDDPPSTLPANWTLFANGGATGATGETGPAGPTGATGTTEGLQYILTGSTVAGTITNLSNSTVWTTLTWTLASTISFTVPPNWSAGKFVSWDGLALYDFNINNVNYWSVYYTTTSQPTEQPLLGTKNILNAIVNSSPQMYLPLNLLIPPTHLQAGPTGTINLLVYGFTNGTIVQFSQTPVINARVSVTLD